MNMLVPEQALCTKETQSMELLQLPDLVLHQILRLLGPLDLLQLASTSRDWFNRIRNDDSLWVPHLKTYSYGIWNEIIEDFRELGDVRISDWFVHYCRKLMAPGKLGTREIPVGRETWIKECDRNLAFETAILARSFEVNEDSLAPIGILVRRYLYSVQLFRRKNPYIDFLDPLPEDARSDLERLGQARERDLLARRHKNLQSNYVCFRKALHNVDFETCDQISKLFPSVDGKSLEPIFACRASSARPMIRYSVCQSSARWAEMYQEVADLRFDEFFSSRNHDGLRKFCELVHSGVRKVPTQTSSDPGLGPDAFVARCRERVRRRMNRIIHAFLVPRSSPATDICRVDLSDAQELGGDNPKQEMLSSVVISDRGALLVMQLIGRNRF